MLGFLFSDSLGNSMGLCGGEICSAPLLDVWSWEYWTTGGGWTAATSLSWRTNKEASVVSLISHSGIHKHIYKLTLIQCWVHFFILKEKLRLGFIYTAYQISIEGFIISKLQIKIKSINLREGSGLVKTLKQINGK